MEEFLGRISELQKDFTWKKFLVWFLPTILWAIILKIVHALAEDRVVSALNKYIDDHAWFTKVGTTLRFLVVHPVQGTVVLLVLTIIAILIHAYISTRPRKKEPYVMPPPQQDKETEPSYESILRKLDSHGTSSHTQRNPDGTTTTELRAWGSFGEEPSIDYEFSYEAQQAVISVTNSGAIADVWASLRIDGPGRTRSTVGDVFARWSHTRDYKVRLAKGETHHLMLAGLKVGEDGLGATAQWVVHYATDKTVGMTEAFHSSVLGSDDGQAPDINMYVKVFSNPESEQTVPECHIVLHSTKAEQLRN